MVIHINHPLLQKEPYDNSSGHKRLKSSISSLKLSTPTTPISPRLSSQTSIRRDYSVTTTVTVAGPAYSTIRATEFRKPNLKVREAMAQTETETIPAKNSDPTTQEFRGDLKVNNVLPSRSTLESIADLPVFDVHGNTVPFKSLYWSDAPCRKRVMIIFIRHFFCGVCCCFLPPKAQN
jgi:hypothetical protein